GKHQKTIRIIDDEDIAERCRIWIRKQNYKFTPALFKKFVEYELLP
ncbi:4010_t:CDS:1, partial [Funneliformis geosporum]